MRWLPDDVLAHLREVAQPEPGEPRASELLTQNETPSARTPGQSPPRPLLTAGERLGDRYVIVDPIGAGGMGTVYRARDLVSGQDVAVKVLHSPDSLLAARLEREAAVLAQLAHPGIVRPLGRGATNDLVYLTMELLEGETLAERLQRAPMGKDEAVEAVRGAAEALGAAHRAGLLHRDVKPSNIFLATGPHGTRVMLLDFGLVRRAGHGASLTREGFVVGTPGYMAPEQARAGSILDARADVFSLGCVLYRCLTGVEAFTGTKFAAVLSKVLFDEPTAAETLVPGLPPALTSLLKRMLSKNPSKRPLDAQAVADALEGLIDGPVRTGERRSITPAEQRTAWVVLAAGSWPELALEATGPWLPAPPSPDPPPSGRDAGPASSNRTNTDPSGSRLFSHLREAVGLSGAALEVLSDGSLVAVMRGDVGPASAAAAARVALAVRASLPDVAVALGIGRMTAGYAAGEAIDEAARLAAIAPGPQVPRSAVRIDRATARLLQDRFELIEDASGPLLLGERGLDEPAGTLLGRVSPLIGRDAELSTLLSLYQACVGGPRARAVVITGEAGIGKSRLARELLARVRRVTGPPPAEGQARGNAEVWVGRADPMRAGSAFDLVGQTLRSAAGIRDTEPLRVRQHKLLARVMRHQAAPDVQRVAEFLGELAGSPFPDAGRLELRAARADAATMRDQLRRAWQAWLLAECAAHPLVILLEDIHWGDLPSMRFIDDALSELTDTRLMVVALARPEVRERFPRLWEARGAIELRLRPLPRQATLSLARAALGTENAAAATWIEEHAEGNPLAIEELIRAAQSGVPDDGAQLPVTLMAVLEARLAALEPNARRLLRAASVMGRAFRASGIAALVRDMAVSEVDQALAKLVEREVLVPRQQAQAPAGEREYAFRHALIRDVVYATLPQEDQRIGHRLAAAWLERAQAAVPAPVLAEHYERGGLAGRASGFWRRAAEQALAGDDLATALSRAERAVECGAGGVSLGAVRLIQAEARRWRGDNAEALRLAGEAMQALPPQSSRWYAAIGETAAAAVELGDLGRLRELATLVRDSSWDEVGGPQIVATARLTLALVSAQDLAAADELLEHIGRVDEARLRGEPAALGRVYHARALRAQVHGDLGEALDLGQAAYALFQQAGDRRSAALSAVSVGDASRELGAYAAARVALREGMQAAEALGLVQVAATARLHLGAVLARTGFLAEAAEVQRLAMVGHRASGNQRAFASARARLAEVLAMQGSYAEAEMEVRAAIGELGEAASSQGELLATLAWIRLRSGNAATSVEPARAALDGPEAPAEGGRDPAPPRAGPGAASAAMARLTLAEALHALGDFSEAASVIHEARDHLLRRAARISSDLHRQSFMENVPEHARTLSLAAAWTEPPPPLESEPPGSP